MRDLAQQNLTKRPDARSARIKILIIAAIVVGAIFVIKSRFASGGGSSLSVILQNAPNSLKAVSYGGSSVSEKCVELMTESADFRDISGDNAKATAARTYGDGSFALTVNATLPDPKGGDKYQVWLVGEEVVDAGIMDGAKNSWSLVFRDKDKYSSAYNQIWITREITTNDGKPEKHILEGSF